MVFGALEISLERSRDTLQENRGQMLSQTFSFQMLHCAKCGTKSESRLLCTDTRKRLLLHFGFENDELHKVIHLALLRSIAK
jgi:hypothetical protein